MKVYEVTIDTYLHSRKTKEDITKLIDDLSAIGVDIDPDIKIDELEPSSWVSLVSGSVVLSSDRLLKGMELGLDIKVKRPVDVDVDLGHDISDQLQDMVDKTLKQLTSKSENVYNTRCEVHMSNFALMHYNETLLLQDSCTDELQDALGGGWRIIAACPQPDQRRPDYILGRFNPDFDNVHRSAARREP